MMTQKLTATSSVEIHADANTVWEALTDPEKIKKYFFGTETRSEWKVGSPITFTGVWEGKPYEDKGTILEIIPGQLLRYNYWSSFSGTEDQAENYANITYRLETAGNITRLMITQDS